MRDKNELSDFEGPLSLILMLLSKNKIEIIQNRQDHSLEIKDESYFREQKQIERDDFDLEM